MSDREVCNTGNDILRVQQLQVTSTKGDRTVPLVRDASFAVGRGELFCLVGESGSGKSVSALGIMGLIQQSAGISVEGSVTFQQHEVLDNSGSAMKPLRGKDVAMIFQDPMSSLDPVFKIDAQLREAVRRRESLSSSAEKARIAELLSTVGIADVERCLQQYPHQLSGGMCQRVMIAMALACRPQVLIADEPTTALDVTIQAQILGLLNQLRQKTGMAIVLITHDLGIAAQVADRVAVMYAGRVVEQGSPAELFKQPSHPYTVGLLASIPKLEGPRLKFLPAIPGGVPDPTRLPSGCAFHPRCPAAIDKCAINDPPLAPAAGRPVACWEADKVAASGVDFTAAP